MDTNRYSHREDKNKASTSPARIITTAPANPGSNEEDNIARQQCQSSTP
jgi:hypothetical protein